MLNKILNFLVKAVAVYIVFIFVLIVLVFTAFFTVAYTHDHNYNVGTLKSVADMQRMYNKY